jgi:hypothetical protein
MREGSFARDRKENGGDGQGSKGERDTRILGQIRSRKEER